MTSRVQSTFIGLLAVYAAWNGTRKHNPHLRAYIRFIESKGVQADNFLTILGNPKINPIYEDSIKPHTMLS